MDRDGSGYIDYEEFSDWATKSGIFGDKQAELSLRHSDSATYVKHEVHAGGGGDSGLGSKFVAKIKRAFSNLSHGSTEISKAEFQGAAVYCVCNR